MKSQKLYRLFVLSLLFSLGIIYGAQVFVSYSRVVVEVISADSNDEKTENSEENVKETSHHLFVQERTLYHLKPVSSIAVNFKAHFEISLPEAYLKLNTPPPDFA